LIIDLHSDFGAIVKSRAQKISEAEGRAVTMARRVGGGTRRAIVEKQFEFFRKDTANEVVWRFLQKLASQR